MNLYVLLWFLVVAQQYDVDSVEYNASRSVAWPLCSVQPSICFYPTVSRMHTRVLGLCSFFTGWVLRDNYHVWWASTNASCIGRMAPTILHSVKRILQCSITQAKKGRNSSNNTRRQECHDGIQETSAVQNAAILLCFIKLAHTATFRLLSKKATQTVLLIYVLEPPKLLVCYTLNLWCTVICSTHLLFHYPY